MVHTCSQVRSLITRTRAVAPLSCATADGGGLAGVDGPVVDGVGAGVPVLADCREDDCLLPLTRLMAARMQITTSVTAIAAAQLARFGSAWATSGSTAAAGTSIGCGGASSEWVRSNSATSGPASMSRTQEMLRMCPRA